MSDRLLMSASAAAASGGTQPVLRQSRVAGKSLLAISAGGMIATFVALFTAYVFEAAVILLATTLTLDILLRRAVARFHTTSTSP
jgi:hypothetical protein